jgi:hypothetical protein
MVNEVAHPSRWLFLRAVAADVAVLQFWVISCMMVDPESRQGDENLFLFY